MQERFLEEGIYHFDNRLKNKISGDYTPANPDHYPNPYKWDLAQIAIGRARLGDIKGAISDLNEIFAGMHPNGFIPNVRFINGRLKDPERLTFKDKSESSYTQPTLEAQAALEIYRAFVKKEQAKEGKEFMAQIYNKLKLSIKYFENFRENGDGSHLVGIIHPHETGRDSGPEFDKYIKQGRLPTIGPATPKIIGYANSAIDYAAALALNVRLMGVNWNPRLAREKKIFWANDVMFNCMYAKNLYDMSQIANIVTNVDDKNYYFEKGAKAEREILSRMWDGQNKMFYGIDIDNKHMKKVTVSNLFPIILPNTSGQQVERILDLLEDPEWFGTKYPIPSVPTKSREYDPHFVEKRLWRGPVWVNMNWHIAEGLLFQSERFEDSDPILSRRLNDRALFIINQTAQITNKYGMWEFYDPENGKGYRISPFGWSGLAKVMQYDHPEYLDRAMDEIYRAAEEAWNRKSDKREQTNELRRKDFLWKIFEKV